MSIIPTILPRLSEQEFRRVLLAMRSTDRFTNEDFGIIETVAAGYFKGSAEKSGMTKKQILLFDSQLLRLLPDPAHAPLRELIRRLLEALHRKQEAK